MEIREVLKPVIDKAVEKQVEYCKGVLKERGLPESLIWEKKIRKEDFYDREGYYEYWYNDTFLFSEVINIQFNETNQQFYCVQHLDTNQILYVKPTFEK